MTQRLGRIDKSVGDALKPYGYYAPTIAAEIADTEDCWNLNIAVDKGAPVEFRNIEIQIDGDAKKLPGIASVIAKAPKSGEIMRHSGYDTTKRRLQQILSDNGFLDAKFDSATLNIFPDKLAADISLRVMSGPRSMFGEIRIDQNVLEDSLIQRYIRIAPGEPFERQQLDQLQSDLSDTTFFNQVLVTADYAAADGTKIPIDIVLTPADKLGYFVGIGASTDQGPRARGGYRNRRVNSRGHQFDSGVLYSPVLAQIQATYRQPLKNPLLEWQTYEALFESEETDTAKDRRFQLGVERTRALANNWLFTYGVSASESRFTVAEVTDSATLLTPILGLTRRLTDNPANPRSGSAIELRLRGASRSLLSSTDFVQAYVRYRRLFAIGEKGRLSLRGELGTTWQDDFDELPPSVRFFAGGDNSVRGYGYQSIGPRNDDDEVIGGSQLATASIEYEHTIRGAWGVAAFVDSGNAFDDVNINPRTGVGIGVVWRSPVGPLRAYIAKPLDESGLRLHINFGVDL